MTRGLNVSAVVLCGVALPAAARTDTNPPFRIEFKQAGGSRWKLWGIYTIAANRDEMLGELVRRGFEVRWTGQQ